MSAKESRILSAAERNRVNDLRRKGIGEDTIREILTNAALRNGHSKPPSAPSRPATTSRISARR